MRFRDKVVLVTGAATGIGYGMCEAFAREGATVILNDIDDALATNAAQTIARDFPRAIQAYACDGADLNAIQTMIKHIVSTYGKLDVLVANAGITAFGDFLELSPKAFDGMMNLNVRGSYFISQYAAKAMIEKQVKGRILLMSSNMGHATNPKLSAYAVSKAAIRMMAKALAFELGEFGITVNALAPGATLTERTRLEHPDYAGAWAKLLPTKRIASIEDIASAALFLASEEARQITGETLNVDGGWASYGPYLS
jgi:glucose 1-dehydrogenase